jgi:hypothetical protein
LAGAILALQGKALVEIPQPDSLRPHHNHGQHTWSPVAVNVRTWIGSLCSSYSDSPQSCSKTNT